MHQKLILIGNLTADPELRDANGTPVANFTVATNDSWKNKQTGDWESEAEFHNCVVWRDAAERATNTLKKGKLVYIEGKLKTRKWQDKDGNARYNTDVVVQMFRNLSPKEEGAHNSQPAVSSTMQETSSGQSSDNSESGDPGDLPF